MKANSGAMDHSAKRALRGHQGIRQSRPPV